MRHPRCQPQVLPRVQADPFPVGDGLPAVLVAVFTAAVALAGCSASGPAEDAGPARIVHTDQGDVSVPADPQRVVVLNYALAGYLYDLDVPVVATVSEDSDKPGAFSGFWKDEAAADKTGLLPWSTDGFDYEAILAAEPDLIVAGGFGLPYPLAAKGYDRLSAIAPTVLVSNTLATWREQFGFLAKDVFGKPDIYDKSVAEYDKRVTEVKQAITPPPGPVAYLTITADNSPYLLFENMGLPQTLAAVGLQPAPLVQQNGLQPYKPGGDMAELSTEQVGRLVTTPTVFIAGFNADTTDVATLSKQPVYAKLPAFAGGHAYDLPYWTVRGDYDEAMALLDLVEKQFS
ncbi:ABC transporter substrate-binding protein [Nocardia carnea]|uniref:ABC transporter substrate-binding protein n=1 Tax=Nocardia carnea TaxID=37328 RepID=UPI002457B0CE|nr:ABC transporter substrate-binding protein [Nocardia carnea]